MIPQTEHMQVLVFVGRGPYLVGQALPTLTKKITKKIPKRKQMPKFRRYVGPDLYSGCKLSFFFFFGITLEISLS